MLQGKISNLIYFYDHANLNRFQLMEQLIEKDAKDIGEMNLEEMDLYWEQAKIKLKNK